MSQTKTTSARDILTNWEKQDAGGAEETGASKSYPVIAALGFAVLGALSGLAGKTLWDNGQIPIDSAMQGLDQNGDGAEDYTYFFRGVGRPAYKTEADFNFDGRTDFIAHYDATGVPERDQRDNDFNGVFETNTTYRDGNALRSDVDTNRDGAADLRVYYRYGVLDREEISDLETGRVVRVNYYRNSLLHRAETDLDRDGSLETATLFDRYGQPMPGE